jgi:2-polyprenyl-6-methoxyphenol hydroxylase-like FAD-dependent oxidoreductase
LALALALDRYGLQVAVHDEPPPDNAKSARRFNLRPSAIDGARRLEHAQDLVGRSSSPGTSGLVEASLRIRSGLRRGLRSFPPAINSATLGYALAPLAVPPGGWIVENGWRRF